MKKVLVPTDFSPCAANAVDFAVQSAKFLKMEITLMHAFQVAGNIYTDYMGVNREFTQSMLGEAYHNLEKMKLHLAKTEGVEVSSCVYTHSVTESILLATVDRNIDFLIMGTLGASGIKEKLWGSETGAVIGKTKIPVIVVPAEYKWKAPKKILLVTNYFEKEPVILDFLFELAGFYQTEVHVAVVTNEEEGAVEILEHGRKISQYEIMLKEKYKADGLTAAHLFGTDFEKLLEDYIEKNEISMLAMVTHQRTFLDRLFYPSMTKRMSYHTKIPLVAIPRL
ncbi:MAG TPA: universal stress protein [Daejeonella sp.]|nr:universal stress protein [Daejeonella sp.]